MSFCSWNNKSPWTSHKVLQRQDVRWLPSESIQCLFVHFSVRIFLHPGWERSECNMFPSLCTLGGCQTVENNCFQTPDYATIYSVSNQQNPRQRGVAPLLLLSSKFTFTITEWLKKKISILNVQFSTITSKARQRDENLYFTTWISEAGNGNQTINWHGLLLCTIIIFSIFHCPGMHLSTSLSSGSVSAFSYSRASSCRATLQCWGSVRLGVVCTSPWGRGVGITTHPAASG